MVRRTGQIRLAGLVSSLASSPVLQLHIPDRLSRYVSPERIEGLPGAALKRNEDVLDTVDGYIYVPRPIR